MVIIFWPKSPLTVSKNETSYFVAEPEGGTYETLPRSEIRKRVKEGSLKESRLVWHKIEQAWKAITAFPDLKKSQRLVPSVAKKALPDPKAVPVAQVKALVPTPRVAVASPKVAVATPKAVVGVPKVVTPKAFVATPVVAQPSAVPKPKVEVAFPRAKPKGMSQKAKGRSARASRRAARSESQRMREKIMKSAKVKIENIVWMRKRRTTQIIYGCVALGIVLLIWFMNIFGASGALKSAVAHSEFSKTARVSGNFSYLVNFNSLVIHLKELPKGMSGEKLVDLLTVLAVRTQDHPITGSPYYSIRLAKGSDIKYIVRGETWKELANQQALPANRRAMLIVDNLYLPNGRQALDRQSDNIALLYQQKIKLFDTFYETYTGTKANHEEVKPNAGK